MELDDYQKEAFLTDQFNKKELSCSQDEESSFNIKKGDVIPFLGLIGETGTLLTEYKKSLRDGSAHLKLNEMIAEELGDILWYVGNIASKFNLSLNEIAEKNIQKCNNRWGYSSEKELTDFDNYDSDFQENEKLPIDFKVIFNEETINNSKVITLKCDEFSFSETLGDPLTDNSQIDDGYRYHDVFHFSFVVNLSWSPVVRKIFNRKRRSNKIVDEVQDGGRASVIDESLVALIFTYAKDHNFLKNVTTVDYNLLRTIKNITDHLEVKNRTLSEWQKAIIDGFRIWNLLVENHGGVVHCNQRSKTIKFSRKNEETLHVSESQP